MFTRTATINTQGTQLFYADSGPVPGSDDYTTVCLYHGTMFYGPIFYKLFPYCASHNIRLVVVNRKEYPGSSKYTDDEIEDLHACRQVFLQRLGTEVADFLVWFINAHDIPRIGLHQKSGGIAVVGWSMGAATILPLLAYPELVPAGIRAKLSPYIKDYILYDPPYLALGYSLPADHNAYNPLWTDPDCESPEERYTNFKLWISSYFKHPDVVRSIHDLDFRKQAGRPSVLNIPACQFQKLVDVPAAARSELPLYSPPMQRFLRTQTDAALFDQRLARKHFPHVRVCHMSGYSSAWECVWCFVVTQRKHERLSRDHADARPMRFVKVDGENHFLHWDNPEKWMDIIAEVIHS